MGAARKPLSADLHRGFLWQLSRRAILETVEFRSRPHPKEEMMSTRTSPIGAAQRVSLPRTRSVAVIVAALAAFAVPAVACGSSTPSPPQLAKLRAFSRCMRAHGVPNFPDPQPGASNAKSPTAQQLGVTPARLSAAESACQHLLPPGVNDRFPPSEIPLLLPGMRRFSRCMRSHGVPNWPDPAVDAEGRPFFPLSRHGFTRQQAHSQQITRVERECQHLLPTALGGTPIG
jgi:hypothetical protein